MILGRVEDTGVGVAPEDIPKLFTRFGKLLRTAEMNHDGIGLGLSITKSVVEKSGGSIQLTSDGLGKGTKVSFSMCVEEISNHESPLQDSVDIGNHLDSNEQDGLFILNLPEHLRDKNKQPTDKSNEIDIDIEYLPQRREAKLTNWKEEVLKESDRGMLEEEAKNSNDLSGFADS